MKWRNEPIKPKIITIPKTSLKDLNNKPQDTPKNDDVKTIFPLSN